jgi:tetratricopeptide (TPR) repeat protein
MGGLDIVGYRFYRGYHLDAETGQVTHAQRVINVTLTRAEANLLTTFLKRPRQVLRRDSAIAFGTFMSSRRLDDCVYLLKKKLGLGKDELIVAARGRGYVLDTDDVQPTYRSDAEEARILAAAADINFNIHEIESLKRSLDQANRAIEKDPLNLENYITAAYSCINRATGSRGSGYASELMPQASRRAEQALAISGSFGAAFGVLGLIAWVYEYDWKKAESLLTHAISLNPQDTGALLTQAYLQVCTNRKVDAFETVKRAVLANPQDRIVHASWGWIHLLGGDLNEAIRLGEQSAELDPSFSAAHGYLGRIYEAANRNDLALREYERAFRIDGSPMSIAAIGRLYGKLNDRKAANAWLDRLHSLVRRKLIEYVPPYCVAAIHVGMDEYKETIAALEAAYDQRCDWLILLDVEPWWEPIRKLEEFRALAKKVRIPS